MGPVSINKEDDNNDLDMPAPLTSKPVPYRTLANAFGLFREYVERPSIQPDENISLRDLTQSTISSEQSTAEARTQQKPNIFPFSNTSSLLFLRWFHNGVATKSIGDRTTLITDVFHHPEFNPHDIEAGDLAAIESKLDQADSMEENSFWTGEGWQTSTVNVSIPFTKGSPASFAIPNLRHRSITKVVVAALRKKRSPASALHYVPFRSFWKSPAPALPDHVERIFDELYSSDIWLKEHAALNEQPPELCPDGTECKLPRAIAALMFWSDATQLANFGTAKLWPLYLFLGNQSKWLRGKSSARECHHIAYFTSVRRY